MKIEMTDTRHVVSHGLMEAGREYDVPDELGAQLIRQDVAEKARPAATRTTKPRADVRKADSLEG